MGLKLTTDRAAAICDALEAGATREVAARHGGLSSAAVRRYLAKARTLTETDVEELDDNDRELVYFLAAYEAADIAAELRLATTIAAAAETDWRAAAWLLPRRFPQRWAVKSRLSLEGAPEHLEGVEADTSGVLVRIAPYIDREHQQAA